MERKSRRLFVCGWLLAPVPPVLLFYGSGLAWIVCPYSLCVMFLLYSEHGPTTLVVPGIPEMILALLQFPLFGWIAARATQRGTLLKTLVKIAAWHFIAIIAAGLCSAFLHYVWH